VFAGTAVTVAAGTDFVVEGTVDFVGFGAEDGGEVVGHGEVVEVEVGVEAKTLGVGRREVSSRM